MSIGTRPPEYIVPRRGDDGGDGNNGTSVARVTKVSIVADANVSTTKSIPFDGAIESRFVDEDAQVDQISLPSQRGSINEFHSLALGTRISSLTNANAVHDVVYVNILRVRQDDDVVTVMHYMARIVLNAMGGHAVTALVNSYRSGPSVLAEAQLTASDKDDHLATTNHVPVRLREAPIQRKHSVRRGTSNGNRQGDPIRSPPATKTSYRNAVGGSVMIVAGVRPEAIASNVFDKRKTKAAPSSTLLAPIARKFQPLIVSHAVSLRPLR